MATGDKHHKHCQTLSYPRQDISGAPQGMYDETVEVNARDIESPPSSDEEPVKAAMAKFNPPVRHTARHDFDSESESESEVEKFGTLSEEDQSPDRKSDQEEAPKQKAKANSDVSRQSSKNHDSSNSDTDSADLGVDIVERVEPLLAGSGRRRAGVVVLADGAYDPKHYQDLKVSPEMENVFQYIMKYTPQKIDISLKLSPFVPEFVPAVGDTDAFLKVSTPPAGLRATPLADHALEHIDNLGLTVLDEPSAEQSDSALLHLQLRALSKSTSAKSTVFESSKIGVLRSSPNFTGLLASKMPDIDSLMEEWPDTMEDTLNEVGFPPANIDCTLSQYVDFVCSLFDIPVQGDSLNDRIQALHLLFNLYSAVKNSQLYAEREKEKVGG
ncbi:jg27001 [Pararge aegeria aegeria]|uniref:Intraflagellar transport protein 46 homolog n=1 Tax=Pararge aegeria aegeria TaxID=348720 RepID=A0A8S4RVI3_9NEOP|nr:jg27001 [Pararge aegeria aegeria]